MGRRTRALCVATDLLGNGAVTRALIDSLNCIPEIDVTSVVPGVEDYRNCPAPWWARLTNPWHAQFIARWKTRNERRRDFDILWLHGWENAVALRDLAGRMPAAVLMDSVPATMNQQLRLRGAAGWKQELSFQIHHRSFRAAAAKFQYFLPKTSDCSASLIRDYGVDASRCFVTLAPQDLTWWAPPRPRDPGPPWRMLFVGNDFARKGGDFLLELFARHLAGACTLKIFSNDPSLEGQTMPEGASWIKGATREQVREAFWDAHLFLFPTRQDFGPQVLAEAASAGLPAISSLADGIHDLIRDGDTGFVLPREASCEQWAAKIKGLINDPGMVCAMSERARAFAEQRLGMDRFERLIADLTGRLRGGGRSG